MSKNVVDTIIEYSLQNKNLDKEFIFIPSRRQIEYNGGYVNNWTTEEFVKYVKSKNKNILIERDHGGPGQGSIDDDGYESLLNDTKYMDIIHIDPWKKYQKFEDGLQWTIDMINYCYSKNKNIEYEIATEEGIRLFEIEELELLIIELQRKLSKEVYNKIKYLVIQCGTKLIEKTNIGVFDKNKLSKMIKLANKYNLIAKEHNGDWISKETVIEKSNLGLKCINIAPEFGEIETQTVLPYLNIDEFFTICFNSKKWVKWVSDDFIPSDNKEKLILICGHYVISYPEFIELKNNLNFDLNQIICQNITNKLNYLYE